jgi:putative Holliday junction resolvase
VRFMALDIGERRIGVAISEGGVFAAPHSVLHRKSKQEDFNRLQRLISDLDIEHVVVGIPYSLTGVETEGPQARRIKRYARAMAQAISTPIDFADETYSTVEAHAYLHQAGKDIPIDAAAAAVLLQKYLDKLSAFPDSNDNHYSY